MDLDAAVVTCRECGREPGSGRFCAYCGARVEAGTDTAARGAGIATGRLSTAAADTGDVVSGRAEPTGSTARAPSRRRGRIAAVGLLVAAVAAAVWLQQPDLRPIERAGGLASYGGSTSDQRAGLTTVLWSTPLTTERPPADVAAVVADPRATAVVTDEAVWVLTPSLDDVLAELPRLRGLPRPDREGHLALLDDARLLVVDPATAGVVATIELSARQVAAPTWGTPTSRGWAFHDAEVGTGTFVHVSEDGAVWSVPDVETARVLEVDRALLLSTRSGLQAHETETGVLRWRVTGAAVVATGDRTVAVVRPDGALTGLSSATGEVTWRIHGGSVELVGGNAAGIIAFEDQAAGTLVTIDPTSGAVVARYAAPTDADGEPLLAVRLLGDQLAADDGRQLTVFDAGGRVRWRLSTLDLLDVDADGDVVVVTTTRGTRVLQGAFGDPYLPALPSHARALDVDRPAVSGPSVQPVPGLVVDLASGDRERGRPQAPGDATVLGLADGFWELQTGRSIVTGLDGATRWQSGGSTVPLPVADTERGVVAVLDDGAIGAVRLVDPTTGLPTGTGVLDAGLVRAVPVTPDVVAGTWRDRTTDEVSTVAIEVGRGGLTERWRSPERGDVVGLTDGLLWLAQPGRLVGLDAAGGRIERTLDVPVLGQSAVLLDGVAVVATDTAVVGVPLDGSPVWRVEHDERTTARPVVGGDRVHVGLADGRVVTLDADGTVVDARPVGAVDVRSLVVAGERLLVRTANRLVVLGDGAG